ncbi:MAG: SGNH/GDSL hydrolase family protein [Mariniblastus sp.]
MRTFYSIVLLLLMSTFSLAQSETQDLHDSSKWKKDIAKFEIADTEAPSPKNAILFVGSSSIRLWDLKASFPDFVTINRGFGGSQLADSVQYSDRIVLNHKPKTIVMYAGDNDINAGKSPERVFADFAEFVAIVQKSLPETTIHFVAIKPSIKRWKLADQNRKANHYIATYCGLNDKLFYVDIDKPMIGEDGKPMVDLFVKDGLHMSDKGYKIWKSVLLESFKKPGGIPKMKK